MRNLKTESQTERKHDSMVSAPFECASVQAVTLGFTQDHLLSPLNGSSSEFAGQA